MEHISNSLENIIQKPQELTGYLESLKMTLHPEDQQIIQVKYESTRFGKMSWEDLNTHASALLIKINAITGWVIPDETLEVLLDQFRKHLIESYGNVNPSEVEYAFRKYGTVVKDWGKQMNLSLIDEVMVQYMNKRGEISEVEERIAMKKEALQIEHKEDMSDRSMTEWFKDRARHFELYPNTPVAFAPLGLYEWLDRKGMINKTAKEKHEYLAMAVDVRHGSLIEAVTNNDNHDNRKALSEFAAMKDAGCFKGDDIDRLKKIAKQLILKDILLDRDFKL